MMKNILPAAFGRLLYTWASDKIDLSTDATRLSHSMLDGGGGREYAIDNFVASWETERKVSPERHNKHCHKS